MVARRVGAERCSLETAVEFDPRDHRHLAGITAYYNTLNWYYLYLTRADDGRAVLELLSSDSGRRTVYPELTVDASTAGRVGLRAAYDGPVVRFAYDLGDGWRELPVELDATILSDEHAALIIDGEPAAWASPARSSGCGCRTSATTACTPTSTTPPTWNTETSGAVTWARHGTGLLFPELPPVDDPHRRS
ncbi:beta-xylosidase family glycoside hydrolase [Catellatospora bangladeshensis]